MDVVPHCTCTQNQSGSDPCHICGGSTYSPIMEIVEYKATRVPDCVPRLVTGAISGALTGLFALVGGFTGAITGALAGCSSDCGVLRGAGVGAVEGAVLSVDVLEASHAYRSLEQSGSRGHPSMVADFVQELFRGSFVDDLLSPPVLTAYRLPVNIANISDDDDDEDDDDDGDGDDEEEREAEEEGEAEEEVETRGLSGDSLKKLPCHTVDEIKAKQTICCTICMQDIGKGEMARSLPRCQHTFHLACVDKWLVQHGSCPICRQNV